MHVPYDHLVVATGAKAVPAFQHALTFGADPAERKLHGLLADLEQGYIHSVAFVVPPEAAWTLPLYEIALMTARQAWSMGMDRITFTLVTAEDRPLAMFGGPASEVVADLLATEGIEFVGSSYPTVERGAVVADPSSRRIEADRVISLPRLEGRRLAGVPCDDDGFIPVDAHGRVPHLAGVYAAGDGTSFPIKQGGLATQQADAVAEAIAAAAGADVEPEPFRPVLRGMLLTGGDHRYFRAHRRRRRRRGRGRGPHPLVAADQDRRPLPLGLPVRARRRRGPIEEIRAGHIEIDLPLDAHATAGHS